jgi:hypothetical protein
VICQLAMTLPLKGGPSLCRSRRKTRIGPRANFGPDEIGRDGHCRCSRPPRSTAPAPLRARSGEAEQPIAPAPPPPARPHPPEQCVTLEVRRYYASFSYQAQSWNKPRRVVAKVEWHPGELYPRVGFIVTNLARPAERIVAFYNQRGTAEQGGQERNQVDAAVMPDLRRQRRPPTASRARV